MQLTPSPFAPAQYPEMPSISGITFATFSTGMRYKGRDDLLLVCMQDDNGCVAGSFTQSYTASPSVKFCQDSLNSGVAPRALIVNAGISNACTGERGKQTSANIAGAIADMLKCSKEAIYHSATGVIGDFITDALIIDALPTLSEELSENYEWRKAASAIMTTDTYPKMATRRINIDGVDVLFCGISKGSGMIAPNMATMLAYCFSDVNIDESLWREAHAEAIRCGYNAITVDGDTSTSDTALSFSSRRASHARIERADDPRYAVIFETLLDIHRDLAMQIVQDGEGITKRVEIRVDGAASNDDARTLAMSIGNSPLVKTAIFGCDPNWGRVMMAIGKAGVPFDQNDVTLSFGPFTPVKKGLFADVDLKKMAAYLKENVLIDLAVTVGEGKGAYTAWTCDFSYDYVKINADYRS